MSDGSGGAPQLDERALEAAAEKLHEQSYHRVAGGPQMYRRDAALAVEAYLAASPGGGELVALNRDDREWLVELIDRYDETHGARDREDWPGSYKRYMALRARLDRKDDG